MTKDNSDKFDDQLALISIRDLEKNLGFTRNVVYQLEADNEFPRRVAISPKNICYRRKEVAEFLDVRQAGKTWSEHVAEKAAAAGLTQPELAEASPRVQGGV